MRDLFFTCRWLYPHCDFTWTLLCDSGRREIYLVFLLITMLIPWDQGPILRTSSNTNYLSKAPPPNTITLVVRVSTCKFGGGMDIQSISTCLPSGNWIWSWVWTIVQWTVDSVCTLGIFSRSKKIHFWCTLDIWH